MKNNLLTIIFFAAAITCGIGSVDAQITIRLPNIKKTIKPVVQTDATTTTVENTTNTTTSRTTGNSSTNWWVDYQIGEINKYKERLDNWNPANQVFPNPNSNDDYIGLALSKKDRATWLQQFSTSSRRRYTSGFPSTRSMQSRSTTETLSRKNSCSRKCPMCPA